MALVTRPPINEHGDPQKPVETCGDSSERATCFPPTPAATSKQQGNMATIPLQFSSILLRGTPSWKA